VNDNVLMQNENALRADESAIELGDNELALVGGGIGDTILLTK
jgi:hypothetical protein